MIKSNMTMILRLEIHKKAISFGRIATAISESGGDMVAIDVIKEGPETTVRDISVHVHHKKDQDNIVQSIKTLSGVHIRHVSDRTFLMHLGGKIEVIAKKSIDNREELSHVYTPEVARVCMAIEKDPALAYNLTVKNNAVAVVSNATAVLGLGKIKPEAAMPVMEGKSMLFKQFANVNAYPICLQSQDSEEIIQTIKAISPSFGGINLEDIASPQCFEVEERLKEELDIPVFHDDQHGTAIVALAGLLNALKVTKKELADCKVIVCGLGAAGISITKMLLTAGAENVIGVDKDGALTREKKYDNKMWDWCAKNTNPYGEKGALSAVIKDADVFIGVSAPDILDVEDIKKMADQPIVFALANPSPEISPEVAKPYVKVMATGRSDFPNQVNNVLCFPGIFRGALDARATDINDEMKLAAATAIASVIDEEELNEDYIIPGVFNDKIVPSIREAVMKAGYETGAAHRFS
ncbi:NAD-dependent malic enzyme [Alteribacillus sp. YIM 98480]|uniref:NAD-dependent malic enzyme n=1 Tax=Alteribacillus sp. YIM 98480 TaxID=2606599 RepID=UPI001E3E4DC1|nr:NAD-dependent malic enzyme [Alteribacillus sp. YIM 98480]